MNCRNSLCWGPLAIIALCAPLYAHAGVLSASVTLSGPSEGWVQTDLGYVAEPDFTVDADTQQELLAGSAQPEYEYEWSYTPANLVRGGGIADDWMDISYAWADGAAYHTVSVRLTVRVRYNDGTVSSKVATDSMLVKVKRHEISVVAAKSSICAGARANAVHQTSVTATVTDGWGAAPPETVTVTFSVLPHAHVVTQASLSTTNPLATNALGQASVVLTSSDQPGTVTVRAAVSEDIAGTVNVSIQKPTGAPDPEPPITVAAQTSQLLQELLRFGGTVPVPDHSLHWSISEVEDDQGQPVPAPSSEDYGYVQVEANPTDATGRGAGRYCAGTLPGSIRVLATDQNCYNADSTPLTFEFAINVEGPELTSVVSGNGEICAGHQPNGVHQASITALVEFSAGAPAPNVPVAFEIIAQEFVAQPATLSSGQATTGPDGCATVILTSSDQACTITVQATVQSDDPQTTTVSCALPYSEPSPTETSVIPQTGVSSKLLQETLRFGSGTCVPGHALGWEVVELWDVDGNQVTLPANAQDWGSVQATANPTTTGGAATGTYTAGANRCTVLVAAKDTTCYDANGDAPYLDVFEIVVAGLDRLEVSGAYQVGETNKYAIGQNSGYVTITAVLTPAVYGDVDMPLIWTGGMPVEGNPLQRQVAMSPSGTTSVTAQFGMQAETVYILVCRVVALSVYCTNGSAYMMDQSQAIAKADPLDTGGAIVRAYVSPWVPNEPMPPQLLHWEPDYGGAVDGDDRARRVSTNVPYEYHFKCSCGTSSAELTLWVIGIDFNLASDEIYVNTDDDDVSSTQDKNESPVINENDMTTIRPEVLPSNAPIFLEGEVTITGSPGIALWEDDQKTTAPYGLWLNSCPDCLWVEGTQVSSTTGDRTITLQCSVAANYWDWIYGTGETGYWYPGGGMQWDFQEQVHLTVLPREGNSEAYLRLFTNEGLTNEITNNTPIGGTVYPTLYVKIGPGERVKGGTNTVTVRVHDLYDNYDPGTTVDFDTQVDMVSATGWEVEQPDHSWVNATYGPAAVDNKEGSAPIVYRYDTPWNTTSLPTRGNGLHTIGTAAKVGFEEWVVNEGWTNDYECGPWNLKPDVENLYLGDRTGNGVYVTDVKVTEGTIDYFKWDPDAGPPLSTPKIEFKIRDADPGDRYECIVYYRSTSGSMTWVDGTYWAATNDITSGIGTTTNVSIDLAAETTPGHLDGEVHDWGTYTFDVVVVEYKGGVQVDRYALKEPYCLWVPAETPETPAREGHDMWFHVPEDEDAPMEMRAMYWLNDQCNRDAAALEMIVVDPTLSEKGGATGPTVINQMHGGDDANQDGEPDGIKVYEFGDDDPPGTWRCLWTAADACGPHSPHRRTHDKQRMLVANKKRRRVSAVVCLGDQSGLWRPPGFPELNATYLRKAGYAVPRSRVLNQPQNAWGLLGKWLGYQETSTGMIKIAPDEMAYAMDYFGHGASDRILPGRSDPAFIASGTGTLPSALNVENFRRLDGSRFAHLHACKSGMSFASSLVQRGVTAVLAFRNSLSSGGTAAIWNMRFYGYATGSIDGAKHTIRSSHALAEDYFIRNIHSDPGDPTWPDGHYGYTSGEVFGNGYIHLMAP